MIEQQPDRGQDIHSLPLQLMNPLSPVGSIQKVLWTKWPETLVSLQLPHDL